MPHPRSMHLRQRIANKQCVGDGHVDAGRATRQGTACSRRQRAAGAGHVVQHHHRAASHVVVGESHVHIAVTMALLPAHRVVQAMRGRSDAHPLARFFVRRQQQRARHLTRHKGTQQRRRRQRQAAAAGHHVVHRRHAVQVRVHRDHGVERAGQQLAQVALAHHFTGREGHVLAHVGQVGADEREACSTQLTRTGRCQQQQRQPRVGLLQAAQQHGVRGQRRRQAQARFTVRKGVLVDQAACNTQRVGKPLRQRRFVVKGQQHRHQVNPSTARPPVHAGARPARGGRRAACPRTATIPR